MVKIINPIKLGGKEVLPIIEGGKGIGVSNGSSAGSFAAANAIGTFSGVCAEAIDENGKSIELKYSAKNRRDKHEEWVAYSVNGGISQAKIAHDISKGSGGLHINILWEMGSAQRILHGIMEKVSGFITGITCGAGMPFKLANIAAKYNVHYYPIVSSVRAFNVLWKRSYYKFSELLGGVVYEDPWLAGGHNGITNREDPLVKEAPIERLLSIRRSMNEYGLSDKPIIMAGGIWCLNELQHITDNNELAPIAFQFGTRPLLTKESPIPCSWKKKLLTIKQGDVSINRFSPTGFYASMVHNKFLDKLIQRSKRQIEFSKLPTKKMTVPFNTGHTGNERSIVYISDKDNIEMQKWYSSGFNVAMKTPDSTLVFTTPNEKREIVRDQINCVGCLGQCRFSNWRDAEPYTTNIKPDPRSFCISKTLREIIAYGDVENQLMFAGHNVYRFANDPFYKNNFIPTVKQLVDRIIEGM
ncbi:Nitronate monooxygenase [Candidatus Xenohaliotis californiensis]|uniref:Nitronate monooxygenase n=1 Tax=Candidatus Xenohaliotis californiensis TaxID=84677 RepID=A0ABM9N8Y0_9RICK|nr:Nitronate monooxygenase [Candidatus Xenohaliotis californiensis]